MAETEAVRAAELDPQFVKSLNDAITAGWEASHKACNGDVGMLFTVMCEMLSRVVAGLDSAGEHVDLQAVIGHVFSRARQIVASHDGPLTTRREVN